MTLHSSSEAGGRGTFPPTRSNGRPSDLCFSRFFQTDQCQVRHVVLGIHIYIYIYIYLEKAETPNSMVGFLLVIPKTNPNKVRTLQKRTHTHRHIWGTCQGALKNEKQTHRFAVNIGDRSHPKMMWSLLTSLEGRQQKARGSGTWEASRGAFRAAPVSPRAQASASEPVRTWGFGAPNGRLSLFMQVVHGGFHVEPRMVQWLHGGFALDVPLNQVASNKHAHTHTHKCGDPQAQSHTCSGAPLIEVHQNQFGTRCNENRKDQQPVGMVNILTQS